MIAIERGGIRRACRGSTITANLLTAPDRESRHCVAMDDRAKIWVEAGAGGNGIVSFRREAHVPRGGPDGGDGGHGGDVDLVCDASRRDLGALRGSKHFRAGRGGHGEGRQPARRPGPGPRDSGARRAPRRRRSTAAGSTCSIRASARLSPAAAAAATATAGSRPRPGRRRASPSGGRGARRAGSSCGSSCSPTRG